MDSLQHPEQPSGEYSTSLASGPASAGADAKTRHERLFQSGLLWLGIGIFLMGLSFLFNFFLVEHDKSFVMPMYAVTTAGAVAILKGLYDIVG